MPEADSYIAGGEQWRPFYRWAVALGCAELSQIGNRRLILPDPTAALAEELPPIPHAGVSARDFYATVAKALPVLDGGRISDFMRDERAECADPRGDAMVGPSLLARAPASGKTGRHWPAARGGRPPPGRRRTAREKMDLRSRDTRGRERRCLRTPSEGSDAGGQHRCTRRYSAISAR